MITRALTATNDWTFGNGLSGFLTGQAAVEQNIKGRILSWVGDCYWNLTYGIDWKSRLDAGQLENLLVEIQTVVVSCYGVTAFNNASYVFDPIKRNLTITISLSTIFQNTAQITVIAPIVGIS